MSGSQEALEPGCTWDGIGGSHAGGVGPSGAPEIPTAYFDLFFGLCWFSVEISSFAAGGTGTALWSAISFAESFFP